MRKVTKIEMEEFLKNYPRELEKNVSTISTPPTICYYDWTLGNSSVACVAQHYEDWSNSDVYPGVKFDEPDYYIDMGEV